MLICQTGMQQNIAQRESLMANKRKSRRRKAEAVLGVYDRYSGEFLGRLVDMSSFGLRLKNTLEFEKQSIFHLRIDLPFEINGSKEIIFNAKQIWHKKFDGSGSYYTGFQIKDIQNADLEIIKTVFRGSLFLNEDNDSVLTVCKPG